MALDAGSVFAVLGGKFNPAGFAQFDAAMKKSTASSTAAERAHAQSSSAVTTYGNAAKVAALGGIAAVGVAAYASVKAAATFEKQMSALKAVTNASASEMKLMSKAAQELGTKTGIGATAAGQAMTELAKGGISAKDSVAALKGTIALAQAGGMDLATAGETVANALNLFAMKGTDATKVADSFANAANSTTADVNFFSQGLAQGGAAAKAAGLTFDQTTVALEAMAANGFKSGSDAGTSLKTTLVQIAKPTKQAKAEMEKLNLSFFDAHGKIKPLTTISKDLGTAFSGLTKQEKLAAATRIAGTDGMRTLLALADQGPAKLDAFAKANARTGTAAKVAAEQMNNFEGNVKKLKAQAEQLGISLGTALLPYLTKAVGGITAFVGALRGASGTATGLRTLLVAIAGFSAVALIGPKLMAFGAAINDISLAARTAPSFAAFASDLALIANPVGIAAVGLGLLAGAIYLVATREDSETAAARRFIEAKNKQRDAITALDQAERDVVSAKQASKSADDALAASSKALNDLRAQGKQGTKEYSAALAQHTNDQIAAGNAAANAVTSEQGRLDISRKLLAEAKSNARQLSQATVLANTGKWDATDITALYNAHRLLSAAQDRVSISSANIRRLQAGIPQVLGANVAGYATLIRTIKGMPKDIRTRYTLLSAGAAAKIGEIITQLRGVVSRKQTRLILSGAESAGNALQAFKAIQKGVPVRKVISILTNSNSKKDEIEKLKDAIGKVPKKPPRINFDSNVGTQRQGVKALQTDINNLHGKTITITTEHRSSNVKASGTAAGMAQTALVGEGGGPEWIVNRDTGAARKTTGPQLTNLSASEYVIPTESKYRPQALGLLGMLAADLGVSGFASGKAAKKRRERRAKAKQRFYGKQDGRIQSASETATLYETRMRTAETKGNETLWDKLRGNSKVRNSYVGSLNLEKRRINSALNTSGRYKPKGSRLRTLRQNLADVEDLLATNSTAEFPKAESSTYLPEETRLLTKFASQIAIAGIDTPNDTGDDLSHLKAESAYLQTIWDKVKGGSRGNQAIIDVAGDLRSVRDQIAGLTTPGDSRDSQVTASRNATSEYGSNFMAATPNAGAQIRITNHYQSPPEDPHSWSNGVKYELKAAL